MCVCAYLQYTVVCCGRQRAGVPACPGSWEHQYPPPGSVNGSESTARLCGKDHHSQTPRCYKHTYKEKKGRYFQYGFYYDKLLLNSTPDRRIKEEKTQDRTTGNARHKTDSKHFQVKHIFLCFVLFANRQNCMKKKLGRSVLKHYSQT